MMYRPNSIVIAIVLYYKKIMIWVCCNLQITKKYDHNYGKYGHISSVYLIYFSLNKRLIPHIKILYCSCLYIYYAESACMTAIIFNYALLYTCRCPLVQYK